MRKQDQLSFPHPVIGNRDDAAGHFAPRLSRRNDRKHLFVEVAGLNIENENLIRQIEQRHACYVVRVECGASGYREAFQTHEDVLSFKIELAQLYRKIDIDVGVIALGRIDGYCPSSPHPDYEDATFQVEPGELLAVGDGWSFSLLPEWDPLRAPVASLMRVERNSEPAGPMEVVLDADRIIVRLSDADYNGYLRRRIDAAPILHAAIVLPALAKAIDSMNKDEFSSTLWAGRLNVLLERSGVDIDDALRAAQELLRLPISRAFVHFDQLREDG